MYPDKSDSPVRSRLDNLKQMSSSSLFSQKVEKKKGKSTFHIEKRVQDSLKLNGLSPHNTITPVSRFAPKNHQHHGGSFNQRAANPPSDKTTIISEDLNSLNPKSQFPNLHIKSTVSRTTTGSASKNFNQ